MPDLPKILQSLGGLVRYEESVGTCIVFFVRRLSGDNLMYIGWTEDLPTYVGLIEKKARLMGWTFTDVYYVAVDKRFAPAVSKALVRHFRPVMNRSKLRPSATDRKILRGLGLV